MSLLVPILFFVLLEGALRLFDYGKEVPKAFISDTIDSQYLIMNPQVSLRYFTNESFAPSGVYDLFKKEKSDSTFRIFVQGASSSMGFPFRAASFPRLLEQKLQVNYPFLDVEVVNTSIVATNSYSILDLSKDIVQYSPDLVIIYGGHNEFYGALGIGSSQRLGKSPALTNMYLRLNNLKLLQLVRSIVKKGYSAFSEDRSKETLMAKMVREESISLDSDLYRAGLNQYEYNLSKTIEEYQKNGVPIMIGNLVSNLKDFKPFVSTNADSSTHFYQKGESAFREGEYSKAKEFFTESRDRDLLKFRATSDFLEIIKTLSIENEVKFIDFENEFSDYSPNGIIGNELLVEHVHPNLTGQRLMADITYERVSEFLAANGFEPQTTQNFTYAIAELDSMYGYQLAEQLMNNWPFTDDYATENTGVTFLDKLASGEISWLNLMTDYIYKNISANPQKALETSRVLLQEYPNQLQPYLFVAQAHTNLKEYKEAEKCLLSIPKRLKNRQVIEAHVNNYIEAEEFDKALKKVDFLLADKADIHYSKVRESLLVLTNLKNGITEGAVAANPEAFVNVLEAFVFLQKSDEANEVYDILIKFIPQNEALRRIKQRGVL